MTTDRRRFATIADKVRHGVQLAHDDGVFLYTFKDLLAVGALANEVRERLHGDRTFFNVNFHINPTNVCEADCKFCSFARLTPDSPAAYTMSLDQVRQKLVDRLEQPVTEIHIVNGLHGGLPFEYYKDCLRVLKQLRPDIHIKAYTAVEIHYFAEKFGMSYEQVLRELIDAGLGSLPGGGAEVLARRVRPLVSPRKGGPEAWLEVHREAHRAGMRSTATMMYGHLETDADLIEHLDAIRALQDETGGFTAFVPWSYKRGNTAMDARVPRTAGAVRYLRVLAAARLYLDNFTHVQASWFGEGKKTGQVALHFGADDFGGTLFEESVHLATGYLNRTTQPEVEALIREAGFTPAQRTTLYQILRVGEGPPAGGGAADVPDLVAGATEPSAEYPTELEGEERGRS